MTMAEAAPKEAPQNANASQSRFRPSSPALAAGWLLRSAAFAAVAAGLTGVIVAPGVHGNARETVVVTVDRVSGVLGYFVALLLVMLVLWGGFELLRTYAAGVASRLLLIGSSLAVLVVLAALLFAAIMGDPRHHEEHAVLISAAATVAAIAGAYASARAPHTRAVAGILLALAFAAIARLGAFELAKVASERANVPLYMFSRGLATAGVLFESVGQLAAVTWLGTRSRLAGQLGALAALAVVFVLMWGVDQGVHSGASLWQAVLHTALSAGAGVPTPYAFFDTVAIFLVPASLLLALVAAAQPKQVVAVLATVSLALVSRGAFDAPLRALCVVAAAEWAALACTDERAMWRTLLDDRKRRLLEESDPQERRAGANSQENTRRAPGEDTAAEPGTPESPSDGEGSSAETGKA
jgi:hypothetical protein